MIWKFGIPLSLESTYGEMVLQVVYRFWNVAGGTEGMYKSNVFKYSHKV